MWMERSLWVAGRAATARRSVSMVRTVSTSPFRPTAPILLQATQPQAIATPIVIGVSLVGAYVYFFANASGLLARTMMQPTGAGAGGKWVKGGFKAKMDRKEAVQILGLRYVTSYLCSESSVTRNRIKESHRRMMIANHPDRGGSPYLASSTYAQRWLTQKSTRPRTSWNAPLRVRLDIPTLFRTHELVPSASSRSSACIVEPLATQARSGDTGEASPARA